LFFVQSVSYGQGFVTLQDKPFVYATTKDATVWNWLDQQPGFSALSEQQQQFFYWSNVFRKDPQRFFTSAIKEFLQQFPEANTKEVKSLEQDLKKINGSLPYFFPDSGLHQMSKLHAKDLAGRGGIISHVSKDGKDFVKRIKEAGNYRCGAENLFVGTNDPLEALIILLIDHGVPNKGHRMNLIDPTFERMGVSFFRMNSQKMVLVQEFACK
jgi:hypothetical protein